MITCPAMSMEDSKYMRVKMEPPWDGTGLQSESVIDHVVKSENTNFASKNEVKNISDVSHAAQTSMYIKYEVNAEFESKIKESSETTYALHEVKADADLERKNPFRWGNELYLNQDKAVKSEESLLNELKEESESESDKTAYGVSEAAARAGLYLKHKVKEELVVGPEVFQRPKVLAACSAPNISAHAASSQKSSSTAETVLDRACSVKLERMNVDIEHQMCKIGGFTYNFKLYLQGNDMGKSKFQRINQCGNESEQSESSENARNDLLEEKLYKCTYCSFTSVYKKYIRVHKSIAHHVQQSQRCKQCKYACYNKYALQAHINTVHACVFECDQCSYSTVNKHLFKIHKLKHKDKFQCDQCDYSCTRKNNLTHHKWVHSKNKPFKCEHCSYANSRKYELQAHINAMHCSDHVFRCEQCNYATVRKDKLLAHKRMHSFASSSKDYTHVLINTDSKYKCDQCNYDSVREDLLQIHKNMMHVNETKRPSEPGCSSKRVKAVARSWQ